MIFTLPFRSKSRQVLAVGNSGGSANSAGSVSTVGFAARRRERSRETSWFLFAASEDVSKVFIFFSERPRGFWRFLGQTKKWIKPMDFWKKKVENCYCLFKKLRPKNLQTTKWWLQRFIKISGFFPAVPLLIISENQAEYLWLNPTKAQGSKPEPNDWEQPGDLGDNIWCYMIWYDMTWYDTIRYEIWYDMIWYDMIYDIWYMISDICYMIYDMIWYDMICDIWYMIYDIWNMIYVICYMWYVVCDMWYNDTSYGTQTDL